MFELVHYLHIVAATLYVGGGMFFDWIGGTMIARLSVEDRSRVATAWRGVAGLFMMATLGTAVLAGITRLLMSGMIQRVSDLFEGYGLRATLALAVIVLGEVFMRGPRKGMFQGIDEGDDALYLRSWKRHRLISTAQVLIILYLMVSMRLGIY